MFSMNCASFCYLFCCPPCPARIASKLAFSPPCPTYNIIQKQNGSCDFLLTEQAGWVMTESDRLMFEVFYARTARRNSIACLYIRCTQEPKYTILFSHGNAVDLGHTSGFCLNLGLRLNCNMLTYDYTGYGINRGIPSEKDIYADIEAACLSSIKRFGIQEETLILYGQSIGTVPTVQLALKYKVAGIILHSPLMSGLRVAFPNTKNTSCCDAFITVDKIDKIMSPTLIIHGTEDDIIDISHSIILYQKCPLAVEPLWVEGAGHNDIELYPAYLERLQQFIVMEINS